MKPKTRSPLAVTCCLALTLALAGLAACSRPRAKDPRLDETNHFRLDWPLKATTLDAAVAEVEASLGPGLKRSNGTVEWTAQTDETHCARIQLRDEGGTLSANKERLMKAHPDFDACILGK